MKRFETAQKQQPLFRFNWSALEWHFAISFSLIFITPLIDVIIFMPTYMDFPNKEFHYSIWTAILIAILTILANNDIPESTSLMETRLLPIGLIARFLFGFSAADLLLLLIQWLFLYLSWPYLYKNIRFIGYQMIFGTGLYRIIDLIDEHGKHLYVEKTIDFDGCALFLMQTIRLILITIKILLAHSIRWQISQRNIQLYKFLNLRKRKETKYLLPFTTLLIHQGQYFVRRRLRF